MRLDVANLSVQFGGLRALDDVSFTAAEHRVTGIIGPNGAGKSTLLNALTGWVTRHTGTASVDGNSLLGLHPNEIIPLGVVRSFQNLQLFDSLSVRENLAIGRHHRLQSGLVGAVLRSAAQRAEEAALADVIEDVARRVAISDVLDRRVVDLPYGNRKQTEIARALIAEPRLLLLDEPAAGLDAAEVEVLARTLRDLRDGGMTIVLIEHDMSLVMSLCDDLVVLDFGRVIANGTPDEVRSMQRVRDAYLGGGA